MARKGRAEYHHGDLRRAVIERRARGDPRGRLAGLLAARSGAQGRSRSERALSPLRGQDGAPRRHRGRGLPHPCGQAAKGCREGGARLPRPPARAPALPTCSSRPGSPRTSGSCSAQSLQTRPPTPSCSPPRAIRSRSSPPGSWPLRTAAPSEQRRQAVWCARELGNGARNCRSRCRGSVRAVASEDRGNRTRGERHAHPGPRGPIEGALPDARISSNPTLRPAFDPTDTRSRTSGLAGTTGPADTRSCRRSSGVARAISLFWLAERDGESFESREVSLRFLLSARRTVNRRALPSRAWASGLRLDTLARNRVPRRR